MRSGVIFGVLVFLAAICLAGGFLLRASYQETARQEAPPEPEGIKVRYHAVKNPEDILPLTGRILPPVVYRGNLTLAGLSVPEKKEKFFALLLPQILLAKQELADLRREVQRIAAEVEPGPQDAQWLKVMLDRYRAEDAEQLLLRLHPPPTSIVLAQAALESGWGTSRFFREGNNVFGVWSFDPNEPRMAAGETRGDRRIYVKRYPSVRGSIGDYFVTLGRGPYSEFRRAGLRQDAPLKMIRHLGRYSELGPEYIRRLGLTIRSNNMTRFDNYRLGSGLLAMKGQ